MRSAIKFGLCLGSIFVTIVVFAIPQEAVFNLVSDVGKTTLPPWVGEMTTEGNASAAGLSLPTDTSLSIHLLRKMAPTALTLHVQGASSQPLLLNGYAVAQDGETESLTLCSTLLLSFNEGVTIDFTAEEWRSVESLVLLPQEATTLAQLSLGWDTEDLPGTNATEEGEGVAGDDEGSSSPQTVVWVETDSPSRECPASALLNIKIFFGIVQQY